MITVEVTYKGGYSRDLDAAVEKAAGKRRGGSGMWIDTGVRDMAFDFRTRSSAEACKKRIKKALRNRVSVHILKEQIA